MGPGTGDVTGEDAALCGRGFLGASQDPSEPGALPLTLRTKAKPPPRLAMGPASLPSCFHNHAQPHACFLWGSICKPHLIFALSVRLLLRHNRKLEQHLDSPYLGLNLCPWAALLTDLGASIQPLAWREHGAAPVGLLSRKRAVEAIISQLITRRS